jgi:hypothetical protein
MRKMDENIDKKKLLLNNKIKKNLKIDKKKKTNLVNWIMRMR